MKNGIVGYVSFIFTVLQLNSTTVKILYLENICIFHKHIFSSGWHKADFLVNEAFQMHLSSLKESKKRRRKKAKKPNNNK